MGLRRRSEGCTWTALVDFSRGLKVQHREISATASLLLRFWYKSNTYAALISYFERMAGSQFSHWCDVLDSLYARTKTAAYNSATLCLSEFSRQPHFQHRNLVFIHHQEPFKITGSS
jgi:hypothetical protein